MTTNTDVFVDILGDLIREAVHGALDQSVTDEYSAGYRMGMYRMVCLVREASGQSGIAEARLGINGLDLNVLSAGETYRK